MTALRFAVSKNRPAIVKYLLASDDGYDVNERLLYMAMFKGDNQGELVSEIVSAVDRQDIIKELKQVRPVKIIVGLIADPLQVGTDKAKEHSSVLKRLIKL